MTSLSWRWTFLVSVPIAVVVVFLGMKFIPKDKPSAENSGHDIWGAVTLALGGMLGLVYTLVSAPEQAGGDLWQQSPDSQCPSPCWRLSR